VLHRDCVSDQTRCVAVCCSVSQCVALCCGMLQYVTLLCSVSQERQLMLRENLVKKHKYCLMCMLVL